MALVVANTGENKINDLWIAGQTIVLGLYQNDYTPVAGSVYADFTAATFSGYAAQNITFGICRMAA